MLKYFKRQKNRGGSLNFNKSDQCNISKSNVNSVSDEIDSGSSDAAQISTANANAIKRHSLRSTSSFCDEVFLEQLTNLDLMMTTNEGGTEEDAISYSALSLGGLSNDGSYHIGAAPGSVMALNSVVEFDEDRGGSLNFNKSDQCNISKSNVNSVSDEIDSGSSDAAQISTANANAIKRHSLRSTSSFCDEVFLEQLTNLDLMMTTNEGGTEEDAISYSALSLGGLSNDGSYHIGAAPGSVMALNSVVEFDEDRGGSLNFNKSDQCNISKSNVNSVSDEIDSGSSDAAQISTANANAIKRHSLRSTSSFCDEVFLEQLTNLDLMMTTNEGGTEEDAISYSALSLGGLSNDGSYHIGAAPGSVMALNSVVEFDEDLFKYHSRLSMFATSIVNEPNCLSYFVQYLEKRDALSLIKFYLDIENFKNGALAQSRKEQKHKLMEQQIPEESTVGLSQTKRTKSNKNTTDDHIIQNKQQLQQCNDICETNGAGVCDEEESSDINSSNVPELKTLCDLTMRKPLTDDEKSQIYAETNKQLTKCNNNDKNNFKASSELSLCSFTSNLTEISECAVISMASVQDALTIYQKYLSGNSPQHIEIPVDILSKISLVLCKKETDMENCAITSDCFTEAQQFILNKLEREFLNDFLQSTYYAKYCVELIQGHNININDILHSEVTLFYLMEYLEQHQERDCLQFWSSAINYRKSYLSQDPKTCNEKDAQSDAMIIYEKFFSLQTEVKLWSSNKLRAHVESCICTEGLVFYCFDLPLKVAAKYLEFKYLKMFLKSSLFANYLNELKTRTKDDIKHKETSCKMQKFHKPLRRCVSDKISNRHRKTLSDCTLENKVSISQHNTLLASMDSHSSHLKQFQLNIDSSQLTNPDLLWHRSNSNNLKFGRVNSLGRYERDFVSPSDALHHTSSKSNHNWSLNLSGNKIKNAMRKLVHLPDDNVQEEIAWQVAEMIVKDVTNVTMPQGEQKLDTEDKQK